MKSELYFEKLKQFLDLKGYFLQLNVQDISSNLVRTLRNNASRVSIKSIHLKIAQAKVINCKIESGQSVLFYSKDKQFLIQFFKNNSLKNYKFYKQKSIAQGPIVIPKGNLKIKAGLGLNLFQKYGKIKLTKGFIQLLEPMIIAKGNEKLNKDYCILLKLMDRRQKVTQPHVKLLFNDQKKYSINYVNALLDEDKQVEKLVKSIRKAEGLSPHFFELLIPEKIAKIYHLLNITTNNA